MNRVVLPDADAVLPAQPVQWWYWTGHLAAGPRRFGFEACFFAFNAESLLVEGVRNRLDRSSGWLERRERDALSHVGFQMVDIALTDVATGRYDAHVLFAHGMPPVVPGGYALDLSFPEEHRASAEGGGGQDRLHLDAGAWMLDLDLSTDAGHPPALHYDGGRHDYAFGGYTFYYSRPRQTARGRLMLNGETFDLSGTAWFDRQYGDLNEAVHQGWQWFAIQLRDDRQIMLFDIIGYAIETLGAVMERDRYTRLGPGDFSVEVLRRWTSPVSHTEYPAQWRLVIGAERFIVTPTAADQELREVHPFPTYWEGDCLVTSADGDEVGQAYVELQGFGRVTP
jgi:predicted secreted hydrolase